MSWYKNVQQNKAPLALVCWTFLLWTNRLINIQQDPDGTITESAVAIFFVAGASIVTIFIYLSSRKSAQETAKTGLKITVFTLSIFGILRWAQRTPFALVSDESFAFKTVHLVLAIGTVIVSVLASMSVRNKEHL